MQLEGKSSNFKAFPVRKLGDFESCPVANSFWISCANGRITYRKLHQIAVSRDVALRHWNRKLLRSTTDGRTCGSETGDNLQILVLVLLASAQIVVQFPTILVYPNCNHVKLRHEHNEADRRDIGSHGVRENEAFHRVGEKVQHGNYKRRFHAGEVTILLSCLDLLPRKNN